MQALVQWIGRWSSAGSVRVRGRAWCLATLLLALGFAAHAADPQIASFTDSPDPVPLGGLYTYTVGVDNTDVDVATHTQLSLSVPAGASFVSAAPASAKCVAASTTLVQCDLGTLGAGGGDPRSVSFTWRAVGPGLEAIDATATVSADADTNAGNNSQTQQTTVVAGANLALTKTGSPNPVAGGANLSYTLTVSNAGPSRSGNVVLTDTLSPSVGFVSAAGSGWTCAHSASVVTCKRPGPLAVGVAIPPVTLVGKVNAGTGTVTNSATVSPDVGGVADPDTSDNTATADTVVNPGADLSMAKAVSSGLPAIAGQNTSFVLSPRNAGPSTAANAVVTDNLPAGWTFVSASGPNWSCSAVGLAVTCTRASFPVGASDDIGIVAQAASGAAVGGGTTFSNTASVSSDTADPTPGNNNGSVSVPVLPDGADLRLAKSKTPNPVALGGALISAITVTNAGPRVATGPLRVVEALSGESYVGFSGVGWSCVLSASVVVCDHANAAGLGVGASLPTLVINSTASSSGAVSNTACTGSSVPPGAGAVVASPPVQGDANASNDCATATAFSTTVRPDLGITKLTSTPSGGDKTVTTSEDKVSYTLVVTNLSAGTDAATGVRITDTVPAFVAGRTTFGTVSATPSGGTASFACGTSGATVTCTQTGGAMAPGDSVTVLIEVNRPLLDGSFSNTASVGNTVEGDPVPGNNSASDTVVIAPVADVQMSGKSVSPASVKAGENATYVLSYRNNGPSPALNVKLTDSFTFAPGDTGMTVVSVASSKAGSNCHIAARDQITPASPSFTCDGIGTLVDGEAGSVTLVVRPNFMAGAAARSIDNTATVSTDSVESDSSNNSKLANLTVAPASLDLLVNKTDLVDPVGYFSPAPGGISTWLDYRVAVTNAGPSFGTGVFITETMTPPSGHSVRFVCDTVAAGSATCNAPSLCSVTDVSSAVGAAITPSFTCNVPSRSSGVDAGVGELAPGTTKTVFLRFEALGLPAPTGDVYVNTVAVSSNETDSNPLNNTVTERTTVRQRIDLRVTKVASLASVTLNQPFDWTITVVNNGPGNSLRTDLTDVLPAGVDILSALPIGFTKTQPSLATVTGTCSLTAISTGSRIACALGQLNSGGSVTISFTARVSSLPGANPVVNSATVDTDPNKTGGVDFPGGFNTGTSAVSVTLSSLAGTVFQDRDRAGTNSGTQQGSEPGIAGVAVTLTGADAYGNAISRSATTNASGNYLFAGLPPSNGAGYTLTETQPAGFVNSPGDPSAAGAVAPSLGGAYSAGGLAGNSSYASVVLAASTAGARYNFPEVKRASLGGFVYIDANGSGTRDAGDPAIAGATVVLRDAGGALVASSTTDAAGAYSFTGLDPLTSYTLEQPLPGSPAGLVNGPVNPGLIAGAACASGCTPQPDTPAVNTDRIAEIDLSGGNDGTAFNFGERQLSFISGLVWVDGNRDGVLGASEAGRVAGVTVRLVQGADCASGSGLQTTTTAADGSYRFDNVVAGLSYLVCQTQPAGYGTGTALGLPGNSITVSTLPAAGSANNNYGETLASLAGSVYQDSGAGTLANYDNGVRNPGEPGIAGVTVTLSGIDIFGNPVSLTASTDALGNYLFDNLFPPNASGYSLSEGVVPPAAGSFIDGRETAGGAGGSTAVNDVISGIALGAGQQASGYLFAELPVSTLSGSVFIDLNNNGVQNLPGDLGLGGVTITLTRTDSVGAPVLTTTAPDGTYSFGNLRPGTYTITETAQPAGTSNGLTVAGTTGGTVTPPTTTPSAISGVVLGVAGLSTGNNFAEIAASSSIAGRVWLDSNNDGLFGTGESGIAGVAIDMSGVDSGGNPVARSTVTDASGGYHFDSLPPGTYSLREPSQPAGTLNGLTLAGSSGGTATGAALTPSAISSIPLAVAQTSVEHNFGEIPPGQIAGNVWADNNNNGVIDPGEPGLGAVTISLSGVDDLGRAVSLSTTTAADGSYSFANLRPGNYNLVEPGQPVGTVNGQTRAGTLGGSATTPSVTPSAITAIVLTPGGQSLGNNFGELANSPDLRVSKRHSPATFTVNNPGSYSISLRNLGELPTSGAYTVSDRLPAGLSLAATPLGNGWACVGAAGASSFVCTASTVIAAGAAGADAITAAVRVTAAAATGAPVDNAVLVEGGGEIDARKPSAAERDAFASHAADLPVCTSPANHNVCREPTPVQLAAAISGTVWFDNGSVARLLDASDRRLAGWIVELVDPTSGLVVGRAVTGADGSYRIGDLLPGVPLALRFRDPGSGVVYGYPVNGETAPGSSGVGCDASVAGRSSSCVGSGASPFLSVVLAPGQELPQQSLPVDPSGVVYDSGLRTPVAGTVVTLSPLGACAGWDPASQIVGATLGGYSIVGNAISVTVGADGFYQFLFGPSAPASCRFSLVVTPPPGYTAPSALIPPSGSGLSPPGGPTAVYPVQPQAGPPTGAVGVATNYFLTITAGSGVANIIHNHIPVDPPRPTGLNLSKTGDRAVAEVGDSVRYSITVQLAAGALPRQTTVVDRLPAGFSYIRGTAMVDGVPIADPAGAPGPNLAINLGPMSASKHQLLQYRVRVGVGSVQGDGLNRARAYACGVPAGCVASGTVTPLPGSVATNEGQHRVRVNGGVFAPEACVLGKVFVDCNNNHIQDAEELGIPGVRLMLSDGSTLISDSEGKYSLCGLPPRGHVLRIDPLTLPRGARLTTSSNRNLGDAGSLWLDLKNGELHRADFIEGSCSNTVLDQVKARRAQGGVRAPETEAPGRPALRFDSKAHGLDVTTSPQQGTDSAKQRVPVPRTPSPGQPGDELKLPTPALPMNRPTTGGADATH